MRISEGFHRLSAREQQQRDMEIQRLWQQGCRRYVLNERFGYSAVKVALSKIRNTKEGDGHG